MTVLLEGREHEGYETIDGVRFLRMLAHRASIDHSTMRFDAHVLVSRQPKLQFQEPRGGSRR